MRADDVREFALPEEKLTVPELGGDGVVLVRGVTFGFKIHLASEVDEAERAVLLVANAVKDEDGNQLMPAGAWERFAIAHEEQFLEILMAAKRVSGFDVETVKKN